MTISSHAKQRAFERYGIRFTKKRGKSFERTIRLPGNRLACYFEKRWFFMICKKNGVVLTFLSLENVSNEDKQILRQDERYRRTAGDDAFGAFKRVTNLSLEMLDVSPAGSSVNLPTALSVEELSPEVLEAAEKLMKKAVQT